MGEDTMTFELTEYERGIIAAGLRDFQRRMESLDGSCCADEDLAEEQWKSAENLIYYICEGIRVENDRYY